ncbi:MAG: ATP-dependent RNA helicase [Deltaproteobacteria bacterium]|nr:ATP-dependent RNA helicase [Deltaproteobacteria bacterium]
MEAEATRNIRLPIDAIRHEVESALDTAPVVITAPTASGKSTQVPRWLAAAGRVLVVEPRRVACRSLAVRVAHLESCGLGQKVGYAVRDDNRSSPSTGILFATPGVVLRMLARGADGTSSILTGFDTLVLDEFHERRLDVDLILALAIDRFEGKLVVMSATMDGDKVARYVEGRHVHAEGRVHPVEKSYLPKGTLLPDIRGLDSRVVAALDTLRDDAGDILVFLPGKGEIAGIADMLRRRSGLDVLELHGGLTLQEQGRAFTKSSNRRVILSTNVAETSVTLPGIGVVIDSGLVRQTRYHDDRGFLTLVPIAADSADQRAGRAGRLGPGRCLRLWSESARLEPQTPPEIHRESLVPLVLAAAACGAGVETLSFLDPPREHAVQAAIEYLSALGALDDGHALTDRGKRVFGLPLDPPLGRFLVEAEVSECLEDAIDLVAALAVGRPMFHSGRGPSGDGNDLRRSGNDALALIEAVRAGDPDRHGLSRFTLKEARANSRRLREAMKVSTGGSSDGKVDARRLAMTAIAADPRCVHVARRRRGRVAWSNGGTELELAGESAVDREKVEAVAVMDTHAVGLGTRDTRIFITCAMPLPIPWLIDAGLGRDRLKGVTLKRGVVLTTTERVYAKKVIATREEPPVGAMAREALRDLFLRGSILKEALGPTRDRLEAASLFQRLASAGRIDGPDQTHEMPFMETGRPVPSLGDWVLERLGELGVESGEDLALLTADDLLAPELPQAIRDRLQREFPREVSTGDAAYAVEYDLPGNAVILSRVRGNRTAPPPVAYLPPFRGFKVLLRDRRRLITLRKG